MEGQAESQLLNLEEFAAASRLSKATIHRLKRQGKIPYFQPAGKGGKLLFPADAILRAAAATGAISDQSAALNAEKPCRLSGRSPAWMQASNSLENR